MSLKSALASLNSRLRASVETSYQNWLVRRYTKSFGYNPLDMKLAMDAAWRERNAATNAHRETWAQLDALRSKYNKFGEDVRQVLNRVTKRPPRLKDFDVLKQYGIEIVLMAPKSPKKKS